MIDLYFWPTPNGKKITILLEEAGIPYKIKAIHIGRGDQLTPDFALDLVLQNSDGERTVKLRSGAAFIVPRDPASRDRAQSLHDVVDHVSCRNEAWRSVIASLIFSAREMRSL